MSAIKHLLLFTLVATALGARLRHVSARHRQHHHVHGHTRTYSLCQNDNGEMYYYKQGHHLEESLCEKDIAKAKITNQINETGWAHLDIETFDEEIPEYLQGYAAGFVEGRATRDLIRLHIQNTVDGYCDGAEEYCDKLNEFLLANLQWTREQVAANDADPYWVQVNMTLNQLAGVIDGYENQLNSQLSDADMVAHPIFLIQLAGDIEDLAIKFKRPEQLLTTWIGSGHCSALVRIPDDNSDLFFSHVTWSSYSSMLRLQKRYNFKLCKCKAPGHTYTFSSYPGSIPSVDDFILTSAQLAVFETTISNYNTDIMQYTTPKTILCWIRTQVAHRTADTAEKWATTFAKYNSGTYNNQWVIVDYKNFKPKSSKLPRHGLIHVLEQLPGYIQHMDMTHKLTKQRFWPSYNMPYFPDVYNDSKTAALADKYGDWFTYDKCPRALIFKRDAPKVQNMDDMQRLMRSNNYENDPLSVCEGCTPSHNAENVIACRSDLNPADGSYPFDALGHRDHGATDMKLTNSKLMKNLQFVGISGPTSDGVPMFSWKTSTFKDTVKHVGQPIDWNFGPVTHKWDNSLYV